MAAPAQAEHSPPGPASRAARVSFLAHVVLATVGVAFLLRMASPMQYTGVVGWYHSTGPLLLANALIAASVAGVVEGIAVRAQSPVIALVVLGCFGMLSIYLPGLFSAHWFEGDFPGRSDAVGLAVLAWVLTVALEYGLARVVAHQRLRRPVVGRS